MTDNMNWPALGFACTHAWLMWIVLNDNQFSSRTLERPPIFLNFA